MNPDMLENLAVGLPLDDMPEEMVKQIRELKKLYPDLNFNQLWKAAKAGNKSATLAATQVRNTGPTPVAFAASSVGPAGTSSINTDNDTWTDLYREGEKEAAELWGRGSRQAKPGGPDIDNTKEAKNDTTEKAKDLPKNLKREIIF